MSRAPSGNGDGPRVGPFEFLRDVLSQAIDKGQFPSALAAIILLAVIWKISPTDLGYLLGRLIDFARRTSSLGYWMAIVSLFGWRLHIRLKNRMLAELRVRRLIVVVENEVARK